MTAYSPKAIAVDIGGTKLAVALFAGQQLVEKRLAKMPAQESPEALQQLLSSLCGDWILQAEYIAVATTGVYRDGHVYAVNHDIIDYWHGFPLLQVMQQTFELPVYILNDATAATWGEYRRLHEDSNTDACSIESILYLTVSTGVGGGMVLNNELLLSKDGLAGHVGHSVAQVFADANSPENKSGRFDYSCGCGRWGCVEVISSGTAIARHGSAVFNKSLSTKEVFELAQQDSTAEEIICRAAEGIASLIANCKAMLDVEAVFIGGSVGMADGFLSRVEISLANQPDIFQVPVYKAQLMADSGLIGAAQWAQQVHSNQ